MHQHTSTYGSDPTSPNTTFVQADPSTFRAIVQQLTGAPDHPSTPKLPITHPNRPASTTGHKRHAFKLHERRHSAKNLHINLNTNITSNNNNSSGGEYHDDGGLFQLRQQRNGILVSPVSPLDFLPARASPRSPCEEEEEEERAIAEKGFYFHPSPLSTTPRGADHPPELLPLFPLRSPVDHEDYDNN